MNKMMIATGMMAFIFLMDARKSLYAHEAHEHYTLYSVRAYFSAVEMQETFDTFDQSLDDTLRQPIERHICSIREHLSTLAEHAKDTLSSFDDFDGLKARSTITQAMLSRLRFELYKLKLQRVQMEQYPNPALAALETIQTKLQIMRQEFEALIQNYEEHQI